MKRPALSDKDEEEIAALRKRLVAKYGEALIDKRIPLVKETNAGRNPRTYLDGDDDADPIIVGLLKRGLSVGDIVDQIILTMKFEGLAAKKRHTLRRYVQRVQERIK